MRQHIVGDEVTGADFFCGFGGSSQGIKKAGATLIVAANHNELAVEVHGRNFPDVDHWQVDLVDEADPQVVNRAGKKVPGRYMHPADLPAARFVWASPSCIFLTRARSKQVMEEGLRLFPDEDFDHDGFIMGERSRLTVLCVLQYAEKHLPDCVVVENVCELMSWGPDWDGSTYRWWLQQWANLGQASGKTSLPQSGHR